MPEQESWTQMMCSKADSDLFDILAHGADYRPEVVAAAKEELARRNVEPSKLRELGAVTATALKDEQARADAPLPWALRILMACFSFGLPQIILGEYYRNKGFKRRFRECWTWMLYGLAFWLAIYLVRGL